MTKQVVTVTAPLGLHARPAGELVTCAKAFESDITFEPLGRATPKIVDAKSIMKVLSAAIKCGEQVEICAEGADEAAALAALVERFGQVE